MNGYISKRKWDDKLHIDVQNLPVSSCLCKVVFYRVYIFYYKSSPVKPQSVSSLMLRYFIIWWRENSTFISSLLLRWKKNNKILLLKGVTTIYHQFRNKYRWFLVINVRLDDDVGKCWQHHIMLHFQSLSSPYTSCCYKHSLYSLFFLQEIQLFFVVILCLIARRICML